MPQRNEAPANPRHRSKKDSQAVRPKARTAQPILDPPTPPASVAVAHAHLFAHPTSSDILALIRHALSSAINSPDFLPTIQTIKGLLYDRKWLEVFNPPPGQQGRRILETYAGRWVPGRVLCFRHMWAEGEVGHLIDQRVKDWIRGKDKGKGKAEAVDFDGEEDAETQRGLSAITLTEEGDTVRTDDSGPAKRASAVDEPLRITSIGGGAGSEYLAIAALIHSSIQHHSSLVRTAGSHVDPSSPPSFPAPRTGPESPLFVFRAVDIGSWTSVLHSFHASLSSQWALEPWLSLEFCQSDILFPTSHPSSPPLPPPDSPGPPAAPAIPPEVQTALGPSAQIYTLLFTLSELLAQSRASTIRFFSALTSHAPPGALLVVADAASDISDLSLGGQNGSGRAWPGWMIVDELLCGRSGQGGWEKIQEENSRWFRLGEEEAGVDWPVKIENTRYWLRVFRRRGAPPEL